MCQCRVSHVAMKRTRTSLGKENRKVKQLSTLNTAKDKQVRDLELQPVFLEDYLADLPLPDSMVHELDNLPSPLHSTPSPCCDS